MGNEICLSMHPRNFGFAKIVRPYVRPPIRMYVRLPFMLADVKYHAY